MFGVRPGGASIPLLFRVEEMLAQVLYTRTVLPFTSFTKSLHILTPLNFGELLSHVF